jgi:hypothetical protein
MQRPTGTEVGMRSSYSSFGTTQPESDEFELFSLGAVVGSGTGDISWGTGDISWGTAWGSGSGR